MTTCNTQNTILPCHQHPIWRVSLTPGTLPLPLYILFSILSHSPLSLLCNLTSCCPCLIHPLPVMFSTCNFLVLFLNGMHACLTIILPLLLPLVPLLILFVELLLLSCHAVLLHMIRQDETVAFDSVASDRLVL